MTGVTPAAAARKKAANGGTPADPIPGLHIDPRVDMRRPYILESGSFYKRIEADLNYADTELEMIRVNMRTLQARETDLIAIRDAALQALGRLQGFQDQLEQSQLEDQSGEADEPPEG
jgi:hypothetical protein